MSWGSRGVTGRFGIDLLFVKDQQSDMEVLIRRCLRYVQGYEASPMEHMRKIHTPKQYHRRFNTYDTLARFVLDSRQRSCNGSLRVRHSSPERQALASSLTVG